MKEIHTINEWMIELGRALSEGDGDAIMSLQDLSDGWLQPEDELKAQQALLTGALDSIGW